MVSGERVFGTAEGRLDDAVKGHGHGLAGDGRLEDDDGCLAVRTQARQAKDSVLVFALVSLKPSRGYSSGWSSTSLWHVGQSSIRLSTLLMSSGRSPRRAAGLP